MPKDFIEPADRQRLKSLDYLVCGRSVVVLCRLLRQAGGNVPMDKRPRYS